MRTTFALPLFFIGFTPVQGSQNDQSEHIFNELFSEAVSASTGEFRGSSYFLSILVKVAAWDHDFIYQELARTLDHPEIKGDFRERILWTTYCLTRVKYRLPDSMDQWGKSSTQDDPYLIPSESGRRRQILKCNPSWPIGTDDRGDLFYLDVRYPPTIGSVLGDKLNVLEDFMKAKKRWPVRSLTGVLASDAPVFVTEYEPREYLQNHYDLMFSAMSKMESNQLEKVFAVGRAEKNPSYRIILITRALIDAGVDFSSLTMRQYGEVWNFAEHQNYAQFLRAKQKESKAGEKKS